MPHVYVVETCLLACTTGTWCVDTGATNHVCNSLQGFQETRRLADGEICLWLGDTSKVAAKAVGEVSLHFGGHKILVLRDCLYVPQIRRNLILISCLALDGYSSIFDINSVCVKYGVDVICSGMLKDNLYLIEPNIPLSINSLESNHKRKERSSINKTHLWHLRLGHINLDRIRRLVTCGHLSPLDVTSLPVCEPCLEGKMTMRPFKAKGYRAKEVLELVHSDLCGPLSTSARGGYEYFVTFIDDYSRYGYIYLMHHKSETFEKFKEFKAEVENHRGKSIKTLRSDRGGEYLLGEFRQFLEDHGITSQMSAPGQPQ